MNTKIITVESFKQIIPLGGMQGPILKPFKCNIEKIRTMVVLGNKVVEHGPNGETVKLNLDNYCTNNFKVKEQPKNNYNRPKQEEVKPVIEEEKEEVKVQPQVQPVKNEQKQDFNKKNK